jgi:hypothetical protein
MYFCNAGISICVLHLGPCLREGPADYLLLILTGCAASEKKARRIPDNQRLPPEADKGLRSKRRHQDSFVECFLSRKKYYSSDERSEKSQ